MGLHHLFIHFIPNKISIHHVTQHFQKKLTVFGHAKILSHYLKQRKACNDAHLYSLQPITFVIKLITMFPISHVCA